MKVIFVAIVATVFITIFFNKVLEEPRIKDTSVIIGTEYRQTQYDEFEANEEWLSQEFLRIEKEYNDELRANEEWLSQEFLRINQGYNDELKVNEEWLSQEFLQIDREHENVSHPVNVESRNAIISDVKAELLRQVNDHSNRVYGKSLNERQNHIIEGQIDELLKYVDVGSMIKVQRQGNPVSELLMDYVDNVFN